MHTVRARKPMNERVELSARVLENWVAKTANLLVEELDVEVGDPVLLALPAHWRTVAWRLALATGDLTWGDVPVDGTGHVTVSARPPTPTALPADDPVFDRVAAAVGPMTVCLAHREVDGDRFYNSAVCLTGDGVLGRHRKVHLPAGEVAAYSAGDAFTVFDSPVGPMGMLVDHDKTFPESARTLAGGGAQLVACLSAWPASVTNRAPRLVQDRQSRLFDLYDCARAAENQVVWVSANQTGAMGRLRFLGQSKVVGPAGDVLARTWAKAGLALADVDVAGSVARARLVLSHLRERRPEAYR